MSRWIALGVGITNSMAYSYDGNTWYGLGSSLFDDGGYGIAQNGSLLVAVGTGINTIARSSDGGYTWQGLGDILFLAGISVAFGTPLGIATWVAVGDSDSGTKNNAIIYSHDAVTWHGLGPILDNGRTVVWNGNMFVAVGGPFINGGSCIVYSSDGMNWHSATVPSVFTEVNTVAWGNDRWIASATDINDVLQTLHSTDGMNWLLSTPIPITNTCFGLSWSGGIWVAVGNTTISIAYSSNDGMSWTPVQNSGSLIQGLNVSSNGSRFVAVGYDANSGNGIIAYSDNGITWQASSNGNNLIGEGYGIAWINDNLTYQVSGNIAILTGATGTTNNPVVAPIYKVKPVTEIALNAFQNTPTYLQGTLNLTNVTTIGNYAFFGCSGITGSLNLSNVTSLGSHAFTGTGIHTITLSNSLNTLQQDVFAACTNLTTVNLSHVTTIGYGAFQNCYQLSTIVLSDSLITIYADAFSGCSSLPSMLTISSPQLSSIGQTAFGNTSTSNCSILTFHLVACTSLTTIDETAFNRFNSNLPITVYVNPTTYNSVMVMPFPSYVTFIEQGTFIYSTQIGTVLGATGPITNGVILTNANGFLVTAVADQAFFNTPTYLSGTITLSSVAAIGQSSFAGSSGLTGSLDLSNVISLGTSAFYGCGFNGTLTLSPHLTSITNNVFAGTGFTSFTPLISSALTSIQPNAFHDCGIQSYNFIACTALTSIDTTAFNSGTSRPTTVYVNQLTYNSITPASFPSYVTFIEADFIYTVLGNHAILTGANGLIMNGVVDTIYQGFPVTEVAPSAFSSTPTYLSGTLNLSNVTTIGANAFQGCNQLTGNLNLSNVTTIGTNAFQYCNGFNGTLTLSNSLTTIPNNAFEGCFRLTGSLNLTHVTSLGTRAFYGCNGFNALTLSNASTTVGESAFNGCNSLTGSLNLSHVTSLGTSAFAACGFNGTLTLSNSLTTIPGSAFQGCGFTSFTPLASSALTTIGAFAFGNCSITAFDLVLCTSLTSIDITAFNNGASRPTTVYVNQPTYNSITPSAFPSYVTFIVGVCNAIHEHSTNVYRHPGALSISIQNLSIDQAINVTDVNVTFVYIGS